MDLPSPPARGPRRPAAAGLDIPLGIYCSQFPRRIEGNCADTAAQNKNILRKKREFRSAYLPVERQAVSLGRSLFRLSAGVSAWWGSAVGALHGLAFCLQQCHALGSRLSSGVFVCWVVSDWTMSRSVSCWASPSSVVSCCVVYWVSGHLVG